jgi:hypothetical protein
MLKSSTARLPPSRFSTRCGSSWTGGPLKRVAAHVLWLERRDGYELEGFNVSEELEEVENELSKQGKKTDVEAGQSPLEFPRVPSVHGPCI